MSFGHVVQLDIWVPGQRGRQIECRPDTPHLAIMGTATWRQSGGDDKGSVSAVGLSESTIDLLSREGVRCRLRGGYEDDGAAVTLIEGRVVPGSLSPPPGGPDGATGWQISAGALDVARVLVSRSWSSTTCLQVIRYTAGVAGLQVQVASGVQDVQMPTGHAVAGVALDEIRDRCTDLGAAYRVDAGVLSLYPAGSESQPRAPLLAPDTGLLGSPRRAADDTVSVRCTLKAHLRPGDPIVIDSQHAPGRYRIVDVVHRVSSTADGDHLTEIDGRAL